MTYLFGMWPKIISQLVKYVQSLATHMQHWCGSWVRVPSRVCYECVCLFRQARLWLISPIPMTYTDEFNFKTTKKDQLEVYCSHEQCIQYFILRLTYACFMMTSSNGNIFRVTGHLCGEFTGPRWIPHTKASDAELWCLLWSAPE